MAKRLREDSDETRESTPEAAHTPKFAELEDNDNERTKMQCTLPPHKPMTFPSYQDFETHYNQSHTNRCRECQKNFPSAHYLDLHLAENHDPIVAARRDKGEKTYACFVEDCDKVCFEWKKRRSHLVDKHGFPKNFDFLLVDNGIDRRRSLLRPGVDAQGHRKSSRDRRGSSATETTQTTEATSVSRSTEDGIIEDQPSAAPNSVAKSKPSAKPNDASVNEITKSMSSLQFVPRSIKFGRKGTSGFAKS